MQYLLGNTLRCTPKVRIKFANAQDHILSIQYQLCVIVNKLFHIDESI